MSDRWTKVNATQWRLRDALGPYDPPAPAGRFPGDPKVLGDGYVYWGQSQKGNSEPTNHESVVNRPVGCRRRFDTGWNPQTLINWAAEDHAETRGGKTGRLPVVSGKPPWASAASGGQDGAFDTLIAGLEALDGPTVVVLHHEPENETEDQPGTYSIADWKGMQSRFRQRMDAYGTIEKVIFAPCLINYTWQHPNRDPEDWWLDGVWDVFGFDSYIYGTMSYPRGQYLDFREWAQNKGIPVGCCEWGLRRDSEDPDNYVSMQAWFDDIAAGDPDMIFMSYFDSDANSTGSGWELREGDNLTETYRAILTESPYAINLSDVPGALT